MKSLNIKTKLFSVTDKNKEPKLIALNDIRIKGITKGLQNEFGLNKKPLIKIE